MWLLSFKGCFVLKTLYLSDFFNWCFHSRFSVIGFTLRCLPFLYSVLKMSFPVSKFDSSSTSFLKESLDGREGYPWHSLGTRDCLPSSKRSSTAGIPAYAFTEVARRSSYGHLGLMDSRVPKLRHRGGQCVTPAWWHWYAGRSSGTSSLAFRSAVMQEFECELGWRNGPEVELYCD